MNQISRRELLINNVPENKKVLECTVMSCLGVAYSGKYKNNCLICNSIVKDKDYSMFTRLKKNLTS